MEIIWKHGGTKDDKNDELDELIVQIQKKHEPIILNNGFPQNILEILDNKNSTFPGIQEIIVRKFHLAIKPKSFKKLRDPGGLISRVNNELRKIFS